MNWRRSSVSAVLMLFFSWSGHVSKSDINDYKRHKFSVNPFSTELMESAISCMLGVNGHTRAVQGCPRSPRLEPSRLGAKSSSRHCYSPAPRGRCPRSPPSHAGRDKAFARISRRGVHRRERQRAWRAPPEASAEAAYGQVPQIGVCGVGMIRRTACHSGVGGEPVLDDEVPRARLRRVFPAKGEAADEVAAIGRFGSRTNALRPRHGAPLWPHGCDSARSRALRAP